MSASLAPALQMILAHSVAPASAASSRRVVTFHSLLAASIRAFVGGSSDKGSTPSSSATFSQCLSSLASAKISFSASLAPAWQRSIAQFPAPRSMARWRGVPLHPHSLLAASICTSVGGCSEEGSMPRTSASSSQLLSSPQGSQKVVISLDP